MIKEWYDRHPNPNCCDLENGGCYCPYGQKCCEGKHCSYSCNENNLCEECKRKKSKM